MRSNSRQNDSTTMSVVHSIHIMVGEAADAKATNVRMRISSSWKLCREFMLDKVEISEVRISEKRERMKDAERRGKKGVSDDVFSKE